MIEILIILFFMVVAIVTITASMIMVCVACMQELYYDIQCDKENNVEYVDWR